MTDLRSQQLVRTWHLVALLRTGHGCTLERLSRALEVTSRTVRRDLEALQLAGFPIYDDSDTGERRWHLVRNAPCPACGSRPVLSTAESA